MRPDGLESLRALQAALTEVIAPDLQTAFAQDAAQTMVMLAESLAAEWDAAADELRRDNAVVEGLLRDARGPLSVRRNDVTTLLVNEVDAALRERVEESLVISKLSARNVRLKAVLEKVICELEDGGGETDLDRSRAAIYRHLREVAVRGWSFFDVSSFRERISRARAELEPE